MPPPGYQPELSNQLGTSISAGKELLTIRAESIDGVIHHLEACMAQELLSYAELAQRLNLSTAAAEVIARGLRLPRYAAPNGRTVVLCNVAELRGSQDEGRLEAGPVRRGKQYRGACGDPGARQTALPSRQRPLRPPHPREKIIASLYDRLDELQRQLDRVENDEADRISASHDPLLLEFFRVAAQAAVATLTGDKAREEVAAPRSWPWWRRASA
jgi:hypothetical protein